VAEHVRRRPRKPDAVSLRRFATTLAISAAGGFVATLLGIPAGWLAGGMLAVAIASLAGVNTDFPAPVRPPVFLVLGVYAGSGVSQETLVQMQTWPASFAILAVAVIALIAGSYAWLHKSCGWDRAAALLSSSPGALTFILATAEGVRTDLKKVAITQSVRLLILIEAIPLVAFLVGLPPLPAGSAAAVAGADDVAIMFAAAIPAGFVLERLALPGGWMLGGLAATAALLLAGIVEGTLPAYLLIPCTVAIGAMAGSRFRPGDLALLPHILGPALVAFAIAALISAAGAALVTLLFGVNFIQTLLAFAPGGFEVLTIVAFQVNVDPAYVAAHHVVRFLALAAAVPILARWLDRRP
jgi:membrane AbrB-like protein